MRTFNYTLNQTEITALYNSGNPQDLDVTTVKAYTSDATAGCRFDYNNRNMGASTWQSSGTVSNTISVYGCNLITP